MPFNIIVFIFSLFLVVQGATIATKYSAKIAGRFNISQYVVAFIVVAFITILPETVIAISSALRGVPEFGIATLFGSNIADLTLIFGLVTLIASGNGLKIESKMLKNARYYLFLIIMPIIFGLNGHYSRLEGVALIISGIVFYYIIFKEGAKLSKAHHIVEKSAKDYLFLLIALALLLVGAHFTVGSAIEIAGLFQINPAIIGMLVVSLGTTMPELFYSLKAAKKDRDGLAVGDILGTVMADATIVVGIVACIAPFFFPARIVYVTGIFMVIASFFLLKLMKTEKILFRWEAVLLIIFWITYAIVEILISRI